MPSDNILSERFDSLDSPSAIFPQKKFEAYCNGKDLVYKTGNILYFCSFVNQVYGKKYLDKEMLGIDFEFEDNFVSSTINMTCINVTCMDDLGFCWKRVLFPVGPVAKSFEKVTVKPNKEKTVYATRYSDYTVIVFSSDGTFFETYTLQDKVVDFSFLQDSTTLRIFFEGGEYKDGIVSLTKREVKKPAMKTQLLESEGYIVFQDAQNKLLFWDKMKDDSVTITGSLYQDKEIKEIEGLVDDEEQKEYCYIAYKDGSCILFDVQANKTIKPVVRKVSRDYVLLGDKSRQVWLINRANGRVASDFVRKKIIDSHLREVNGFAICQDIDSEQAYLYVVFVDKKNCIINITTGNVTNVSLYRSSALGKGFIKTPDFNLIVDQEKSECIKISPKARCSTQFCCKSKKWYVVVFQCMDKYRIKKEDFAFWDKKSDFVSLNVVSERDNDNMLQVKPVCIRAFEVGEDGLSKKKQLALKKVCKKGKSLGFEFSNELLFLLSNKKGNLICSISLQVAGWYLSDKKCYITFKSGGRLYVVSPERFYCKAVKGVGGSCPYEGFVSKLEPGNGSVGVFDKETKKELCDIWLSEKFFNTCCMYKDEKTNAYCGVFIPLWHWGHARELKASLELDKIGKKYKIIIKFKGEKVLTVDTIYPLTCFKKRGKSGKAGVVILFPEKLQSLFHIFNLPKDPILREEHSRRHAEKLFADMSDKCLLFNDPLEHKKIDTQKTGKKRTRDEIETPRILTLDFEAEGQSSQVKLNGNVHEATSEKSNEVMSPGEPTFQRPFSCNGLGDMRYWKGFGRIQHKNLRQLMLLQQIPSGSMFTVSYDQEQSHHQFPSPSLRRPASELLPPLQIQERLSLSQQASSQQQQSKGKRATYLPSFLKMRQEPLLNVLQKKQIMLLNRMVGRDVNGEPPRKKQKTKI